MFTQDVMSTILKFVDQNTEYTQSRARFVCVCVCVVALTNSLLVSIEAVESLTSEVVLFFLYSITAHHSSTHTHTHTHTLIHSKIYNQAFA